MSGNTSHLKVVDFDTKIGQAYQGGVACLAIDAKKYGKLLKRTFEFEPRGGALILAEGELTGHHHHVVLDRPATASESETNEMLKAVKDKAKAKASADMIAKLASKVDVSARFWRDPDLVTQLQKDGVILRTDLAVGFLEVTGDSIVVEHQEHNGIRIPTGLYYVGGQVESAGAEERRVAD